MHSKIICLIICYSIVSFTYSVSAQNIESQIIDSVTKRGIPFAVILSHETQEIKITNLNGNFSTQRHNTFEITHPLYKTKTFTGAAKDSIILIELSKKEEIIPTESQLLNGRKILEEHNKYLPFTSSTNKYSFEFLSETKIVVHEQAKDNVDEWVLLNSLESIEKNKYKYPNKKYVRVVKARYNDGDSSKFGFLPYSYSISEDQEYIKALNLEFYNPLYKDAGKRYDFALIDSIQIEEDIAQVVFFKPKPNRNFIGFTGLLYFTEKYAGKLGGYYLPFDRKFKNFSLAFKEGLTKKNTRFLSELQVLFKLKDIPHLGRDSKVDFTIRNTSPIFNDLSNSNSKWVDMAIFDYEKDTTIDDTWMMTQLIDKDKLEYIKRDTADRKFVLSKTLQQLYYLYDNKIGYRMHFFDINNVLRFNKFEAVRIGFGLQSHHNLSDIFTFGGYFGYGIKDAKFKFGGNIGLHFGQERNNFLSIKYARDLLEPSLVNFMEVSQDLVRKFFTSRMDAYQSTQISLKTELNPFISYSIILNNYSLKPLYDYIYNPIGLNITETQIFDFSETSLFFNIGTPFSDNPNLRKVIYKDKRIQRNISLNVTKGWDIQEGGDFDYWKFNMRISSNVRLKQQDHLNVVLDAGVMTLDQPYQIMYGGPGTEFKLTGIIINNAFQTMKLYGFFADRFVHSFINYNLGNVIFKNSKFKPELAFALNVGWGKIKGRKDIHEGIEVRDYSNGYFETGVMLNNLLRIKIYNYLYGGLGVGTFVGYGPDAENGSFAIRVSYEIGAL